MTGRNSGDADSVNFDQERGELQINNYSISDPDVAEFFEGREEEALEPLIDVALRVGVLALGIADTSRQVDHVRRHFERLQNDFQDGLDKHLGDNGRVEQLLNEKLQEFKQAIAVDEAEERGRAEIEAQTRIKGLDFEDAVEAQLSKIAADTGDVLEATGTIDGHLGKKTGDFVYNVSDCQRSIVLEAKNKTKIQQPQIQREMEEGMENRDAAYGIFVASSRDQLVNKVGTFKEFGRNYIAVGLSQSEEDEIKPELLRVAVKWARIRVIEAHLQDSGSVDPAIISERVDEAERTLEQFKQIRGQCTSIETSVDSIRKRLVTVEEEMDEHLSAIAAQVDSE